MFNIDEERDKLTKKLSEQYSQNLITIDEYERILEYVVKVETKREISIIEKIVHENNANKDVPAARDNEIVTPKARGKHLSMFSWRTSNLEPVNGNGGEYTSLFGAHRIIVDSLPKGKTVLNINSIFGLTEIVVSGKIKIVNKITPVFSGIFLPNKTNGEAEELPELHIAGKAVFGNITVETVENVKKKEEFNKKLEEKVLQKIYDGI